MVVLDTNIVILYLHGDETIVSWVDDRRAHGERFGLSSVTVVELLSFPRITDDELFRIELWLQCVLLVDVDLSLAREAARLRRVHKLTTSDSMIAATALLMRAPLVTRDRTLKRVRELHVETP